MESAKNTQGEPSKAKSRIVLVGIAMIFVGPILIAGLYTSGYLHMDSLARTNRGLLISPPVDLRELPALQPLFDRAALGIGDWLLLYLAPTECTASCEASIERLSTIRSVLGYSGQRVHILGLLNIPAPAERSKSPHAAKLMPDPVVHGALMDAFRPHVPDASLPQIVFIDWRKQMVLRFDSEAAAADIKKDLKKLLSASKIR
ncbi:MAG: hypothetical protein O3C28_02540 [Proteobacteria bacterium]|nr:hypothetical protein [Pseudomonadota bacterium]